MASDDWNPQYEEYDAEFNTMREEMDASGIGASFKPLMAYEYWSRCRPSKRKSIVGNARRDNELAIDRAKKAAAAAAAVSEAGNSQAGPSVRGRSNTRSPLAILTTRWIAQRAGSLAGIARWWGVARATASSLMAAVMQVLPSSSPAHILAKFCAPPNPTKPREVFRSEFNRKASLWEAKQVKLATECALAVESLPFGPVKGVRVNLPPPGRARPIAAQKLTARVGRVSTCTRPSRTLGFTSSELGMWPMVAEDTTAPK